jgi:glucose 1-dehydrogenase
MPLGCELTAISARTAHNLFATQGAEMTGQVENTSTAPPVTIPKLLTGQKALVTGANSGIGKAVAIALGTAGAHVFVNYVDGDDAANAVVGEILKFGVKALAHKADVSSEEQVAAMFARMIREFGTIDILVNNAGLQRDSAFSEMTLEKWNKVLGVNLTGQFLCAREAVKEFLRRGVVPSVSRAAGKIICMSSVHQEIPWGGHANYATSKGGIKLLMESMAQELAPKQIRVNAIAPGAIRTPINTAAWNTKTAYDQLMTLVPYGRIGEPEDIARAAVWLASDQSDYVVGTTLFVDGGMTLYPGFATGG